MVDQAEVANKARKEGKEVSVKELVNPPAASPPGTGHDHRGKEAPQLWFKTSPTGSVAGCGWKARRRLPLGCSGPSNNMLEGNKAFNAITATSSARDCSDRTKL